MTRPNKIKIIDADTGHIVREGYARQEHDEPKIFGIFTAADLIKNIGSFFIAAIGVGIVWGTLQSHLVTIDISMNNTNNNINEFKKLYWTGHKELIDKIDSQQEAQDKRLDCLNGNIRSIDKSVGNC